MGTDFFQFYIGGHHKTWLEEMYDYKTIAQKLPYEIQSNWTILNEADYKNMEVSELKEKLTEFHAKNTFSGLKTVANPIHFNWIKLRYLITIILS
jgi:hypothetical protein